MKRLKKRLYKLYRLTLARHLYLLMNRISWFPTESARFVPLFTYASNFQDTTVIQTADLIIKGNYQFLGLKIQSDPLPEWHKDYLSGYRWPLNLYYKIPVISPKGVDIKNVWELSSFFHLLPVAVADAQSRDLKYKTFILNQLKNWAESNPCPKGVNWSNPMTVALRVINLIESVKLISEKDASKEHTRFYHQLIWKHWLYLLNNLENFGLDPANHYLADLVGLLWATLYFDPTGPALMIVRIWLKKALIRELHRQVRKDGFHFEGSSSYHRLVTELFFYADALMKKNGIGMPAFYRERLQHMFSVLQHLTPPHGRLPIIGDNDDCRLFIGSDYYDWDKRNPRYLLDLGYSAFKTVGQPASLKAETELSQWILNASPSEESLTFEAGNKSAAYPSSGLFISKNQNDTLIMIAGQSGQIEGSHIHNDSLSLILWLNGTEIFTDPGSYVYTRDLRLRNHFRSTASHNVLQINTMEQWPFDENRAFILWKNVSPQILKWETSGRLDTFEGEEYGYCRLSEKIVHRRTIHFNKKTGTIKIHDCLYSRSGISHPERPIEIRTHFHLSDQVRASVTDNGHILIRRKQDKHLLCRMNWTNEGKPEVGTSDSWQSDGYGLKQAASKLIFTVHPKQLPWRFEYTIIKSADTDKDSTR